MKKLEVAAIAITQGKQYVMQHRTGEARIGAAGLVGFFGGKIENETAEAAARREVAEETFLVLPEGKPLAKIDDVVVISDYNGQPVEVSMAIFGYELPQVETLRAKEGEVVSLTRQEALKQLDRLTPATRAYFEKLKLRKNEDV